MAVQSIAFIAATWEEVGGSPAAAAVAVAVALAESGGDPNAVSTTQDYGLWQINYVHHEDGTADWTYILEPDINARFAIAISGNGSNWAPWATCYANIGASGWSSYLSGPEPGSAAANRLPEVLAVLGSPTPPPPIAPPPPPSLPSSQGEQGVNDAWDLVREWSTLHGPAILNRLSNAAIYASEQAT